MCMSVLFVCMYIYCTCVLYYLRPEDCARSTGTEVTDVCKKSHGCWALPKHL